jgi:hypothetical protein
MMFHQALANIQWLHVLIAALAYFALGSLWYSPVLFAKKWITLVNIDMSDPNAKKGMPLMFAGSFVCMFIIASGTALLQQFIPGSDANIGFHIGLLIGIMLVSAAVTINYLYTKKPLALFLIDCGYHVAGITIASTILGAWH